MKGNESVENAIINLDSLLGLYPFENDTELSKGEGIQIDSLETQIKQLKIPELQQIAINSPDYDIYFTTLETQYGSVYNTISNNFESTISKSAHIQQTKPSQFIKQADVDPNIKTYSSDNKESLDQFISKLQDGYSLVVNQGQYANPIKISHSLHLVANGNVTICSTSNKYPALTCNTTGGIIEGFQFMFSGNSEASTVHIPFGDFTFIKCSFTGKSAPAVIVDSSANATFIDCSFEGCNDALLSVSDAASVKCFRCTFSLSQRNAIELRGESATFLKECIIKSNKGDGVNVVENASLLLRDCRVDLNENCGINISSTNKNIAIHQTAISGNNGRGINVTARACVTVSKCAFSGNCINVFATKNGTVTLRDNAFTSAPSQLHIQGNEDSIIYSDSDKFTGDCKAAIGLSNRAKFVASHTSFENLKHCPDSNGIAAQDKATVNLTHCTFDQIKRHFITAGSNSEVTATSCTFSGCEANAGINLYRSVNATFTDCHISKCGNVALSISTSDGNIVFDKCDFKENRPTTCVISDHCRATFSNCSFQMPELSMFEHRGIIPGQPPAVQLVGLQITRETCKPVFRSCTFANFTKAIHIGEKSSPQFTDCTIVSSNTGAFCTQEATPIFKGCELKINETGFTIIGASPQIINTKIHSNRRYGIDVRQCSKTLTVINDCSIFSHTGMVARGVNCGEGSRLAVKNTKFNDNTQHIDIFTQCNTDFQDCEFMRSSRGIGIHVIDSAASFRGCIITEESQVGLMADSAQIQITNSKITRNGNAIRFSEKVLRELYLKERKLFEKVRSGRLTDTERLRIMEEMEPEIAKRRQLSKINGCEISDNMIEAIVIEDGMVAIQNTKFESNGSYPIYFFQHAYTLCGDLMEGNTFTNNKGKDFMVKDISNSDNQPQQQQVQEVVMTKTIQQKGIALNSAAGMFNTSAGKFNSRGSSSPGPATFSQYQQQPPQAAAFQSGQGAAAFQTQQPQAAAFQSGQGAAAFQTQQPQPSTFNSTQGAAAFQTQQPQPSTFNSTQGSSAFQTQQGVLNSARQNAAAASFGNRFAGPSTAAAAQFSTLQPNQLSQAQAMQQRLQQQKALQQQQQQEQLQQQQLQQQKLQQQQAAAAAAARQGGGQYATLQPGQMQMPQPQPKITMEQVVKYIETSMRINIMAPVNTAEEAIAKYMPFIQSMSGSNPQFPAQFRMQLQQSGLQPVDDYYKNYLLKYAYTLLEQAMQAQQAQASTAATAATAEAPGEEKAKKKHAKHSSAGKPSKAGKAKKK